MSNAVNQEIIPETSVFGNSRCWWPATQENVAAMQWHLNWLVAQGKPITGDDWVRLLQKTLLLGVAARAVTAAYGGSQPLNLLHSIQGQALDVLRTEASQNLGALGLTPNEFWSLTDYAGGATGDAVRTAQRYGVVGLTISIR